MTDTFFKYSAALPIVETFTHWPGFLIFEVVTTGGVSRDDNYSASVYGNVSIASIICDASKSSLGVQLNPIGRMNHKDFWALAGWLLTCGIETHAPDRNNIRAIIQNGIKELELKVTPIEEKEDD